MTDHQLRAIWDVLTNVTHVLIANLSSWILFEEMVNNALLVAISREVNGKFEHRAKVVAPDQRKPALRLRTSLQGMHFVYS